MRILLILLKFFIASASFAQPGSLQSSFGNGGIVITNMGISGNVLIHAMTIQPDGKIIMAGNVINGTTEDFAIARYNPDGSLDNSFDGDGKVYTSVGPGSDIPCDIALQPDGKIVVVGRAHNGINLDFAIVRYNSDGTLDNTFDLDGKVMTNISTSTGSQHDFGWAVHILNDGKILVGGYCTMPGTGFDFAVARYNADGKCERCSCQHGRPHCSTGYRVSLATVHLNHDRTNNRFDNLAAFCQGCHMWWDHKRHMYNRKYGKETYYRNGMLFSVEEMTITIPKLKNYPKMMSLFRQDMNKSLRWKTLFDD